MSSVDLVNKIYVICSVPGRILGAKNATVSKQTKSPYCGANMLLAESETGEKY